MQALFGESSCVCADTTIISTPTSRQRMDSEADQPYLMLIVRSPMAVREQVDDNRIAIVNNYTITSGIFGRIKRSIGSRQPFLSVFTIVQ